MAKKQLNRPLFSVVVIMKDEESTIGRLISSLSEFKERGGDICILDTGSKDKSVKIAKSMGARVTEVGEKFLFTISADDAKKINKKFIVEGEDPILKGGDKFFNYSAARNYAASLAENDIIFCYDADEVNAKMDIDFINDCIKNGVGQFEYNFVFAKDQWGNDAVKFIQSKAYDRRLMSWTGIVHELLLPIKKGEINRSFLGEDKYRLEHYQNHETNRHSYLKGLALDCYRHPEADRQSHYFARELMWNNRPKSAIKEFKRHVEMDKWPVEKAQSMIFIGDCYLATNNPKQQLEWYNKAFATDSSRREALLKIANFYLWNKNWQAAACYARGAMEIPFSSYYANNMFDYTVGPHEALYRAYGWMGNISGAQEHLNKCLEYQPYNESYLRDTQYYFEYPAPNIEGWMRWPELQWLYETGKKYSSICEVGSWKGRSTHALLSGQLKAENEGTVTCVDTWKGADDPKDLTNSLAKEEDVFKVFKQNLVEFDNYKVAKGRSVEMAKKFKDGEFEAIFIDAGHDYASIKEDIKAWLPKASKILCGHDYDDTWSQVKKAVNEIFGQPDYVVDSIWVVDLEKRNNYIQLENKGLMKKATISNIQKDNRKVAVKKKSPLRTSLVG